MKTKLLMLAFIGIVSANAQTTHHLDWEMGANGPEMDLTIDVGDTVVWTWTDSFLHSVENYPSGSSVETFNSGNHSGIGYTFSHTFTVEGSNDYYCGVHGTSMSGTITVEPSLSVEDETLANFSMIPNPASNHLNIELSQALTTGDIKVYNLLGKQVVTKSFENTAHVQVDVSGLANGLYLVSIASENRIQTKRFIKN